ncbi:MAG: class I SAM-dependent methyltransferase, partial [Lapillicoccus sp.]
MAHHRHGAAPPTRWEQHVTGPAWDVYVARFERLVAGGDDLEGEARFIDSLAPRGARILDGGAGTGRVTAALTRMGHLAIGVDRDAGLVAHARTTYPGVAYLVSDLLELDATVLADEGFTDPFDVVALPGNVLVYVAPGTERDVLRTAYQLLGPGGRFVAGFATDRDYTPDGLDADLEAV